MGVFVFYGDMANRDELVAEIKRVEKAIKKTDSEKLRRDYKKHLHRIKKDLREYDRQMGQWQTKRI